MLFNSWTFWLFFAVVLPAYWGLRNQLPRQNAMLLFASYVFYGWWDWRFLPLIAFSTVMDYALGNLVADVPPGPRRRYYVQVSVVVNLLLLGVFKYYNFFSDSLASLLSEIGIPVSLPLLNLILPVGISFYTFQSMSYVLDISRGVTKPAKTFLDFALYVSFFPHLVAGPIMRSGTKEHDPLGRGLLKQIQSQRSYRSGDFTIGLYHILLGLFKKVVIGDNMAALANTIFAKDPSTLSGMECAAGVYAFAWQIYADFSGYSSIAQGVAKWMGIDLMTNFRMPYLAISPRDFWARWHISLSTWLRDYVYVPLGGNRNGPWLTYRNLLLTMILGGIWHGANWTFFLWGLYHGVLLCVYRILSGPRKDDAVQEFSIATILGIVVMFQLTCLGWLLFRAENLAQVVAFGRLVLLDWRLTPLAASTFSLLAVYAGPLLVYELWLEHKNDLLALARGPLLPRAAAYAYVALMLIVFAADVAHEFIYFQF